MTKSPRLTPPAHRFYLLGALSILALPAVGSAQLTTLMVENSFSINGIGITSISNVSTNQTGGWTIKANNTFPADSNGSQSTDFIIGSTTRTNTYSVLLQEQNRAVNGSATTNFVSNSISTPRVSTDDGSFAYSNSGVLNSAFNVPSIWVNDASTQTQSLIAIKRTVIPTGRLSGLYYEDLYGAQIASPSKTPFYSATYKANLTTTTVSGYAILRGTSHEVLLKTGDQIGTETITNDNSALEYTDISPSGNKLITKVDLIAGTAATDAAIVTADISGASPVFSSPILRKGTLIAGGDGTELWSAFNNAIINDNGDTLVLGSSNNSSGDYIVAKNGLPVVREGQSVPLYNNPSQLVSLPTTISPSIAMNQAGDYLATFATGISSGFSALVYNGKVLIQSSNSDNVLDLDGDGINESKLTYISPNGLAISERLAGGIVDIYFLALVNNSNNEALVRYTVKSDAVVPEPTAALPFLTGCTLLLIRKRR